MMAEAWGRPPWEIEDEAPAAWADRYVEYHNALAKAQAKGTPTRGRRVV